MSEVFELFVEVHFRTLLCPLHEPESISPGRLRPCCPVEGKETKHQRHFSARCLSAMWGKTAGAGSCGFLQAPGRSLREFHGCHSVIHKIQEAELFVCHGTPMGEHPDFETQPLKKPSFRELATEKETWVEVQGANSSRTTRNGQGPHMADPMACRAAACPNGLRPETSRTGHTDLWRSAVFQLLRCWLDSPSCHSSA